MRMDYISMTGEGKTLPKWDVFAICFFEQKVGEKIQDMLFTRIPPSLLEQRSRRNAL